MIENRVSRKAVADDLRRLIGFTVTFNRLNSFNWFAAIVYLTYIFTSLWTGKGLYADGAYVFILRLLGGLHPLSEVFTVQCVDRGIARVIYFYPTLFSFGVLGWSLPALKIVFSATLILHPLLAVFACAAIAGRGERVWILFPIFSLAAIMMVTHPYFIGEFQLVPSVAWPLLFLILFRDLESWWTRFGVCLLVSLLSFVYEGSLPFLITFFAMILTWPTLRDRFATAAILAGGGFSVYFLAHTCNPALLADLPSQSIAALCFFRVQSIVFMSMLFAVGFFARKRPIVLAVLALGFLSALISALAPMVHANFFRPDRAYGSRGVASLLTIFVMVLLFVARKNRLRTELAVLTVLTCLAVLGQSALGLFENLQWVKFLSEIRTLNQSAYGPVSAQNTPLDVVIGDPYLSRFNWVWALPALSIVSNKSAEIKGIVYNPEAWFAYDRLHYQPMDPRDKNKIPEIEKLGFHFDR